MQDLPSLVAQVPCTPDQIQLDLPALVAQVLCTLDQLQLDLCALHHIWCEVPCTLHQIWYLVCWVLRYSYGAFQAADLQPLSGVGSEADNVRACRRQVGLLSAFAYLGTNARVSWCKYTRILVQSTDMRDQPTRTLQ